MEFQLLGLLVLRVRMVLDAWSLYPKDSDGGVSRPGTGKRGGHFLH